MWLDFPRIDNFGEYPDPDGAFPKPDSNIAVPPGVAITALSSGIVSGINAPGGTIPAFGQSVTILLDSPHNDLATHDAYLHLAKVSVQLGQRVKVGDTVGISGNNPQNASTGFAFYPGDYYGFGNEWNQYIQTPGNTIDQRLNPVSFLNSQTSANFQVTLYDFLHSVVQKIRNDNAGGFSGLSGPSQNIMNFMISWANREGGAQTNACDWNTMNTMQDEPGASQCPGTLPGIKKYPDNITGAKALQDALQNGLYPKLLDALANNGEDVLGFKPMQFFPENSHLMSLDIGQELTLWETGKKTPVDIGYVTDIMRGAGIQHAQVFIASNQVSTDINLPVRSQADIDAIGKTVLGTGTSNQAQPNPVGDAVNAVKEAIAPLGNFFQLLINFFQNPARFVKILLGGTLIIVSLVLIVKEFK